MPYDVFISHSHADNDAVRALAATLKARGASVWVDLDKVTDGDSITDEVKRGLSESRVLLAWFSPAYAASRACQWELTAAFLAAQHEGGDVRRRVLVVNAGNGVDHIQPIDLRDRLFSTAGDGPAAIAENIQKRLRDAKTPFGDVRALTAPPWFGTRRGSSNRFVGRLPDLWRVHDGLIAEDMAVVSGAAPGTGLSLVQGMGGIGKSLLAQEYALRFGAAYPGGVFWLTAVRPEGAGREGDMDHRDRQIRAIALHLGLEAADKDPKSVVGMVARHLEGRGRYLWVVDDLPPDATADTVGLWQAPGGDGRTLITTRSRKIDGVGHPVTLGTLAPEDAFRLLTARRKPEGEAERETAREIVRELGCHALAVDVAGAAIDFMGYADFLALLRNPSEDALALAADLAPELPTGHNPAIAATLLESVRRLGPDGLRLLQLASLLAVEPIPKPLILDVFARMAATEGAGKAQAYRGMKDAGAEGLADVAGADTAAVHVLVSRTIRAHHPAGPDLRAAAVAALLDVMRRADDIREHKALEPYVDHARALTGEVPDAPTANLLGWTAQYDRERGAYRAAADGHRREMEAWVRLQGDEHERTLTAMGNHAEALLNTGEPEKARELHETVLAVRRRVLGEEHPNTLNSMNNLAATLRALGDLEGARNIHQRVLVVRRRVLGKEHPDTLTSMNNLAATLWALGDREGARDILQRVLAARRRVPGEEHPDTLLSMNNLAVALFHLGQPAEAKALLAEAHPIALRLLGPDHPITKAIADGLAIVRDAGPAS